MIPDFPLSRFPKEISLLDMYISDHKALLFEVEINVKCKMYLNRFQGRLQKYLKGSTIQFAFNFLSSIDNPSNDEFIETIVYKAKD